MIVDDQSEVIEFLEDPASHGAETSSVQRIDTHGAVIFLAGERAYKMKRAVYFEYMDFSTLEKRETCCRAEIRLNSRTAPMVYRRALPVTREAAGGLALDGAGEAIEWLVAMRRFDENNVLDKVALRGELGPDLAHDIADMACDFLDAAEVHRDPAIFDSIADIVEETARQLAEGVGEVFEADEVETLVAHQRSAATGLAGELAERTSSGFVRHCHGDLHFRNICLIDGRPVLFDAIEFNDRLAIADVFYDLAFLLMDMVHRNLLEDANIVLNRYLERGGDYRGISLLGLYLSVRAGIRAFTAVPAAASQDDPDVAARIRESAGDYLELATAFLEPQRPRLIALGGLSGSGKSTQARKLAPLMGTPPGAVVVRSDVLRKRLFGFDPLTRLGPEYYTPEATGKTYQAMRDAATQVLASGRTVIVDAVNARPEERAALEDMARDAGADFTGFWLGAPQATMAERITSRRHDASDANLVVLGHQTEFDLGDVSWRQVDAGGGIDDVARRLRTLIHGAA